MARGVGCGSQACGQEPWSQHLTEGEGQSISSRDAPGPPDPASGSGASPSSLLLDSSSPPSTPLPRKQERPPLSWSPQATGQLWAGPILVSEGSGSQDGQFLPLG